MELKRYDKFELIPGYENIKNSIPIFATQVYANYLNVIKKSTPSWFVAQYGQDIHYMIPLSIMKKGPFKKGTFLTSTISLRDDNTHELEKEFLTDIIIYIKDNKLCDWIQQCPNWAIFNVYPDGAKYAEFGTYRINLEDKTEEELFMAIKRNERRYINKRVRDRTIKVKKNRESFDDSVDLINSTGKTANLPAFTKKKLHTMSISLKDNFVDYTVYFNDRPQTSVVFFYNSFSIYGMYSGSKKDAAQGASSSLFWEAIKESKKRNIKYFDFVGAVLNPGKDTKLYRIQKFKTKFGTELIEGYVWKMIINKNKYAFYICYMKIMNRLKGKKFKEDFIDRETKKRKG